MGNRILRAIAAVQETIEGADPDRVRSLEEKLTLSVTEFCEYQKTQAEAAAAGVLSTEEALTIYNALGREHYAGGWPEDMSLAVRVVVVKTIHELLARRIAGRMGRRSHAPQA